MADNEQAKQTCAECAGPLTKWDDAWRCMECYQRDGTLGWVKVRLAVEGPNSPTLQHCPTWNSIVAAWRTLPNVDPKATPPEIVDHLYQWLVTKEWGFTHEDATRQRLNDLLRMLKNPNREAWGELPPTSAELRRRKREGSDSLGDASAIQRLESETPELNKQNGTWVRGKKAAELEGLETQTLTKYRSQGEVNSTKTFGRDSSGRVWRRVGTANSHPWYLKSSLVSSAKP